MIEKLGLEPDDEFVLQYRGLEIIPGTEIDNVGDLELEDLASVEIFLQRLAEDREGARATIPYPHVQLTDAAKAEDWKYVISAPPTVIYRGLDVISDRWLPDDMSSSWTRPYRSRDGLGENVNGVAFEVHQPFKMGPKHGEIKKLVVVGRGQETDLVKCATTGLEGNRSPAILRTQISLVAAKACLADSVEVIRA